MNHLHESVSCEKCGYSNSHPFGLTFEHNICSGCITHEEKDNLNWSLRLEYLREKLNKIKKYNKSYDCVVPVIGDAEDYYLIEKVLELELSPLVVFVNDYFKNDIGWHNIHNLITYYDVDSITYNPNMSSYKELVRTSLRKFNHILLPFIQLHTSFPVHVALKKKIPLIIWPQNQSIEQVGKFSHLDAVEMTKWYRMEHDLFNVNVETLVGNGAQINTNHLEFYNYPNINKLTKVGVFGVYLSNFFRWDPYRQNKNAIDNGYVCEINPSSYDMYERAGSSVYYKLHDILKQQRCGYRKLHDHIARDLRHGHISSCVANTLRENINKTKVHIKPFFDWLSVTNSGYKWFLEKRLSNEKKFIAESSSSEIYLDIPAEVLELPDAKHPEQLFITFGKGV